MLTPSVQNVIIASQLLPGENRRKRLIPDPEATYPKIILPNYLVIHNQSISHKFVNLNIARKNEYRYFIAYDQKRYMRLELLILNNQLVSRTKGE